MIWVIVVAVLVIVSCLSYWLYLYGRITAPAAPSLARKRRDTRYDVLAVLAIVGVLSCETATVPHAARRDVAWTRSPTTMSADEFLLTTTRLAFARDPQGVEPGRAILPEESVNRFYPDRPTAQAGQGRFMAREIIGGAVLYWWASPSAHTSLWLDPQGHVVYRGDFTYCDHHEPSAAPHAAFDMIHPASWQCATSAPAGGFTRVGGSSWVSCGGGCCNGAKH